MKVLGRKLFYRYLFVIMAMVIALGSLVISNFLVSDLSKEETLKMHIWAEATKEAASSPDNANINLIVQILESNRTIPVILYDEEDNYYTSANIDLPDENIQQFLKNKAKSFNKRHLPILIELPDFRQYVYYDDSYTLKRLQIFPYIQLGVLAIFVITSFIALLSSKKMEQDRVWVGLSKETAHQLGTPISSLLAWVEYLKTKGVDASIMTDMEKDISRLQTITERFSKIGSTPDKEKTEVGETLIQVVDYLQKRISRKVVFTIDLPANPLYVQISKPLFSWVIENLTKNAVDAMEGKGTITFSLSEKNDIVTLDIRDTGKGLSKSKFKEIFNPGYTTKQRGWGLGLSLSKRIIETYHKGRIYVKSSSIDVGTTFCIELKKVEQP